MRKQQELAERIDEAKDRLEEGDVTGETLANELAAKWSVSLRTAQRYIAYAKDIIDGLVKKREALLQEIRAEVIGDDVRNGILSNLELEAKLSAIVEGKLQAEKLVRNSEGGYERINCLPSHRDIIYAIDKLFRKRGGYDKQMQASEKPPMQMKIVVDNKEEEDFVKSYFNKPRKSNEDLSYGNSPIYKNRPID